jgi:O-antigen/teichoic acid export membrane protein
MSIHDSTVELNRSFRRGFTLTFTADVLTRFLSAVTVVVLIRGLTVSAYAYTTLFLTLAQFAGAAAGGGVRTRYLREEAESVSRGRADNHDRLFLISLVKATLLTAAVAVCVLPVMGTLHLGSRFGASPGLVLYAAALAAAYGATELAIAHHQARRRFAVAGMLNLIRAGAMLIAAVLITLTHQSVRLLSACFVASMVLVGLATAAPIARNALGRGVLRPRALRFNREETWLSLYFLAAAGFAYVDVLVASALLDQKQVATLGASLRYLAVALAAAPSLAAILRVRTAQADMIDSPDAQRVMILRWMRAAAVPVAASTALMAALALWFIPIIDAGRYPGSIPAFQIFLITVASGYLSAPAASVLMAQRRYPALARIFFAGLFVNLIGDVLVAPRFGVIGIAVVSSSVYVALDLTMTVDALRTAAGLDWARPRVSLRRMVARRRTLEIVAAGAIALILAVGVAGSPIRTVGSIDRARARVKDASPSPRWYAPDSLWNTPIGPHPRLAPNGATLVAALVATRGIGVAYDYTPAIWYASRDTPNVPVRIDYPRCGVRTVWVPIPRGAIPDPSPEGHMVIAQTGAEVEYDFYMAQSPNRSPKSSVYYSKPCPTVDEWTADKVVTTNWRTGSGQELGSPRGSGTAEGSGVILPRDTEMPAGATWDHALAISYGNTCSVTMGWCPIVAPATQEDGSCTDRARCLPEGARLQLDPSIDCNTWPGIRYVWQRQLCRTLQVYGGIIIDTNSDGPMIPDQWYGSLIAYTWPWLRDGPPRLPHDLLTHFRVLAWQ